MYLSPLLLVACPAERASRAFLASPARLASVREIVIDRYFRGRYKSAQCKGSYRLSLRNRGNNGVSHRTHNQYGLDNDVLLPKRARGRFLLAELCVVLYRLVGIEVKVSGGWAQRRLGDAQWRAYRQ
jgi:hypothetical protein